MRWRKIKNNKNKDNNKTKTNSIIYATFISRLFAFVTDLFMIGLPVSLVIMIFFGHDAMQGVSAIDVLEHKDVAPPNPWLSITQVGLSMLIYTLLWHRDGQSPGKKLARITIVNAKDYNKPTYIQLLIRFFAYFISFISLIGFFVGLFRKDNRALHDLLSGTAVVYVK